MGRTRTLKIQVRNGIELTTKIPGVFGRARQPPSSEVTADWEEQEQNTKYKIQKNTG